MKKAIILFSFFMFSLVSQAQGKVSFFAADSLKITADLYLKDTRLPFIILLHQSESSRGEYTEIAPKLLNFGYNCLAVDLRSGNKMNFVPNETAQRAKQMHIPTKFIDTWPDILAAIGFVQKYNAEQVILLGSSYSASLALIIANQLNTVKAVVAFSPGEYFQPEMNVKEKLTTLKMPVFAVSTEMEYTYVSDLLAGVPDSFKTIYKPTEAEGVHGAKALWNDSPGSRECWFQLSYFFAKLNDLQI
jgi:pimeloyl-ACP methyl ester carboxylesterase